MRLAAVIASGLILYAAWQFSRRQGEQAAAEEVATDNSGDWLATAESVLSDAYQTTAEFVDNATGGLVKTSSMRTVSPSLLNNANVQAMLRVIRVGEGTADDGGYSRLFGGGSFSGFEDHPRQVVKASGYKSSAAGAYQFISSTWDETARVMGLSDFSPASQDLAAIGRIAARGALNDVIAGRFDMAVRKLGREWASLPGSPYGQPTISMDKARGIYLASGGLEEGTVYA